MWTYVGILRDEKTLKTGIQKLDELNSKFPRKVCCLSRAEYEFRNMLTVAKLIAECALERKESRGAHYRTDYLQTDEKSVHSCVTKKEGELCFVK